MMADPQDSFAPRASRHPSFPPEQCSRKGPLSHWGRDGEGRATSCSETDMNLHYTPSVAEAPMTWPGTGPALEVEHLSHLMARAKPSAM